MGPQPASVFEAKALLDEALHKAWTRGSAESSPLTVLLVSFEQPASSAGVDTLQRALHVHCSRTRDVVVRCSNDQFAAVLPDTTPAGARHVGEQIVEAMRAADNDHTCRVSVGIAVAVPDDQRAPADLLRRAENAVQAARDGGGDRCVGGSAATQPPESPLKAIKKLFSTDKKEPHQQRRTD